MRILFDTLLIRLDDLFFQTKEKPAYCVENGIRDHKVISLYVLC